ncbi:hypothetical protein HHA02_03570 [Cobetia marina]|nr:hypothetical protein HHA02_03570 [Cobetia marina]
MTAGESGEGQRWRDVSSRDKEGGGPVLCQRQLVGVAMTDSTLTFSFCAECVAEVKHEVPDYRWCRFHWLSRGA